MKRWLFLPGFLAVAIMFPGTAAAAPCTATNLATLISTGGTCTEGDKIFSNFSAVINAEGTNYSPTSASGISVTSFTTNEFEHGLTFSGGFYAGVNSVVDVLIGYTVTSTLHLINDIHLTFNGIAQGTGFTSVTETVRDPNNGNQIIGQIFVNTPSALSVSADLLYTVTTANVLKDIFLRGGSDGFANISFIDQVVTQVPIPEPASLLLFGTGLAGIARVARRRYIKRA